MASPGDVFGDTDPAHRYASLVPHDGQSVQTVTQVLAAPGKPVMLCSPNVQYAADGGGPPSFPFTGDRGYGIGTFNALTTQWLKVSQNAAHGDSGACYGDSGGPTFLGAAPADGDTVLAVTSTGDTPCYATNVSSRTDTPSARAFLARFVP